MRQTHKLKLAIDSDESITFSFSKENNELEVVINNASPDDSATTEIDLNSALRLREFLNKVIPCNWVSDEIMDKFTHHNKR